MPAERREARTALSEKSSVPSALLQLAAAVLALLLAGLVARAALSLTGSPEGLWEETHARLDAAGVEQPVTAVLLVFRAYDTWLEMLILALAAMAVISLQQEHRIDTVPVVPQHDPVLAGLLRMLLPAMALAAGYVLWLGTRAPGGAFQAGALLGAAGVLARLGGHPSVGGMPAAVLRLFIVLAAAAFAAVAAANLLSGEPMLSLAERSSGVLVVALELLSALSIGLVLSALFIGATPLRAYTHRAEHPDRT
jgi:multisubunit Na+/H+ antiporter MnhB subunit